MPSHYKTDTQQKNIAVKMIFLMKSNKLVEDRSSGSMRFVAAEKRESSRVRKRTSTIMHRFSIAGKKTNSSQELSKVAIQEVTQYIRVQRDNRDALQRYIERKTDSVATHLAESNELGAIYAMRKLLRAQAEKDFALQAIGQLNKLILGMQLDQISNSDYLDEVEGILSAQTATICGFDDDEFILAQAKKYCSAASNR